MPNRVRFDGLAQRFYEVWYFIFNDSRTGDGFWIRYTLLNPLDSNPSAGGTLWFAHTRKSDPRRSIAIRRDYGRDGLDASPGATEIRIGGATLREGAFRGELEAEGHRVSWDLHYDPGSEPHFYFGTWLRRLAESRTSVTLPNPQIFLSGTVTIDGESLPIDRAVGHQAHHWGVQRASRWLWAHCCAFEEDESAILELLAPAGPGGISFTFVRLHTARGRFFADGLASIANRSVASLGAWRFEGLSTDHRIIADLTVEPRFVQRFVYLSTDYRASECWNTQVADCLVRVFTRGSAGDRLELALRSHGKAAAEIHDEVPERIPYAVWSASEQKQER